MFCSANKEGSPPEGTIAGNSGAGREGSFRGYGAAAYSGGAGGANAGQSGLNAHAAGGKVGATAKEEAAHLLTAQVCDLFLSVFSHSLSLSLTRFPLPVSFVCHLCLYRPGNAKLALPLRKLPRVLEHQ